MVDWKAFLTSDCRLRRPANAMGLSEAKPIAELWGYPTKPVGFLKMSAVYGSYGEYLDGTAARRRLGLRKGTESYVFGWAPAESAVTMWPFGAGKMVAGGSVDFDRRVAFTRNARHLVVVREVDTSLSSWGDDYSRWDVTWWVFRRSGSGRLVDTQALIKRHGEHYSVMALAPRDATDGQKGRIRLHAYGVYVNGPRPWIQAGDVVGAEWETIQWPSLT